jgi:hypothetical protein
LGLINFEEKVNNDLYAQNSLVFRVDEKEYAVHAYGWHNQQVSNRVSLSGVLSIVEMEDHSSHTLS